MAAATDLAFSRTVVAAAAEVEVPAELRAAVFVPVAAPPPEPVPPPASVPSLPVPVEPTPAFATVAFDVPEEPVRRVGRLRTGTALAIAAAALVAGFGLVLLIGHTRGETQTNGASAKPSRIEPASPVPAKKAEPPAKPSDVAEGRATQTAAVTAAGEPRDSVELPVSNSAVPSCRELLGNAFVEKADPEAALTQTQLGNRELVRGKVEASQAAFCQAALWDGAKVERWLNLAQLFLIRRDAEKAVETVEHALELDPKNARALEIQGDAWARLGKLQQARRAYLAAEQRPEPDENTRRWLLRRDLDEAQRSLRSRDFVRAERLFRRVVVFDMKHPGAARGVAFCLRKLNEVAAAQAWESRADTLERSLARKRSAR